MLAAACLLFALGAGHTWAAPTVALSAPANAAVYLAPASVTLQASAAAQSDRTISRVEFYANSNFVGVDATAAYRVVFSATPGSYSLTAKAIDSAGEETLSAARTITVNAANSAPTVSLSQPPNNARYNIPVDLTLAVSVRAPEVNDRVARVEYFLNGASAGVVTASPWQLVLPNVAPGAYALSATATDAQGASTTSAPRNFTVQATNTPPTAALTSPPNNSTYFNPVTLELKANAASPETNGSVVKVEFFANGQLISTDTEKPYAVSWGNILPGVYAITARATDDLGAQTVSAARSVTISAQNAPPTVSIASPANNSHYNGPAPVDVPVRINAAAPETNDAIQKIDLFQNGVLVATLTSSPYTATLSQLSPGTYVLSAVATDAQGAQSTSAPRTVIVDALNRPPTVSLTSPADKSSFPLSASVTLSANASAGEVNGSVTQVEFLVNGEPVGADPDKPYSLAWTPAAAGAYQIRARATDNLGAVSTSAARTITINAPNQPPSVSLTSPAPNASFRAPANITITASASDADGSIVQVEFFQGTTLIATRTASPYSIVWSGVPQGSFVLSARTTDNSGAVSTSAPVSISVGRAELVGYYIQVDHLNTPRLVANAAGTAVWQWDQQELFGNNVPDENPSGLGSFDLPLRLPGQYFDKETNLHYNYFRDYDPSIGRYGESDPIGLKGGLNTYAYVDNNPISKIDPTGEAGFGVTGGGTIEGGVGLAGIAGTLSSGYGGFWGGSQGVNFGGYTSQGGFAGGPYGSVSYPGGKVQNYGGKFVAGLTAGLGAGFFYTNANCAQQLLGPFDTWSLNIPLLSLQYATDGKINFYSATFGKSLGFSISRYNTTTTTASGCPCQ